MPEFEVSCIKECRDGKTRRHYYPGDIDDINPLDPIAQYFTGFPPGTEVYFKERGSSTKAVKETTRVVPGVAPVAPVAPAPVAPAAEEFLCDICGTFPAKSKRGLEMHQEACRKKVTE